MFTLVNRKKFTVTLLAATFVMVVGLVGFLKKHNLINFYEYFVQDGPYINRTFVVEDIILIPDSERYRDIIVNSKYDDDRGLYPKLKKKWNSRIQIKFHINDIFKYKNLINDYNKIKNDTNQSEFSAVVSIRGLIYRHVMQNRFEKPLDTDFLSGLPEKERFPENFLLGVASRKTACGTASEATIALLRDMGLSTRLLRIASKPSSIVANHVFLEYYSSNYKKWVMVDVMENFTPIFKNEPLSAFEYFSIRNKKKVHEETGVDSYRYDRWTNIIWFNKNGPLKKVYYFVSSQTVREELSQLLH